MVQIRIINKVIGRPEDTEIVWRSDVTLPRHPNGMVFECLVGEEVTDKWEVYSVGGGALWDAEGTFRFRGDLSGHYDGGSLGVV